MEAQMYALLNSKNRGGMHPEACQFVAVSFAWQANSSEEAYNNLVCVQGQVIPPVLGFGLTAAQMSV